MLRVAVCCFVTFFIAAMPAHAANLSACSSSYDSSTEKPYILSSIPTKIPAGVDTAIKLNLDVDTWRGNDPSNPIIGQDRSASVSFAAATKQTITHPVTQAFDEANIITDVPNTITVRMEREDGPAVVRVVYSTTDDSEGAPTHCLATVVSKAITVDAPPVILPILPIKAVTKAAATITTPIGVRDTTCQLGALTISISGSGWSATLKSSDTCVWPVFSARESGGISFKTTAKGFTVTSKAKRAGKIPITYTLKAIGKTVSKGSFTYTSKKVNGRIRTTLTNIKQS